MVEKKVIKKESKVVKEKVEKTKEKPRRSLLGRAKQLPKEKEEISKIAQHDPFKTIRFVVMTEKAIQLIEKQNKLIFVVERSATKDDIKKAVENTFAANVSKVQTMIDQSGRKKAFVRFSKDGEAGEIAIRLGII